VPCRERYRRPSHPEELLAGIRAVAGGDAVIDSALTRRLLDTYAQHLRAGPPGQRHRTDPRWHVRIGARDRVQDEGYSPPEKPSNFYDGHESLEGRLAREVPDEDTDTVGDGIGDASDTDGEPYDGEVGAARSGRLVADDEGVGSDTDAYLYARDVGIDGSAASAEEAAVHAVTDDQQS
jgi:uncharacterized protein DUF5709